MAEAIIENDGHLTYTQVPRGSVPSSAIVYYPFYSRISIELVRWLFPTVCCMLPIHRSVFSLRLWLGDPSARLAICGRATATGGTLRLPWQPPLAPAAGYFHDEEWDCLIQAIISHYTLDAQQCTAKRFDGAEPDDSFGFVNQLSRKSVNSTSSPPRSPNT